MNLTKVWDWPEANRPQRIAAVAGLCGLALCGIGAAVDLDQFFHSWLLAFIAWLALALGSLALLMLHYLTGGIWGLAIRRTLEAAARTLPLMGVLFLPLLAGLDRNYVWARLSPDDTDHRVNAEQAAYYQTPFFVGRAAIYFTVWIGLSLLLGRWSAAHDRLGDRRLTRRSQLASGFGLVLYGITITFAGIDWVMSLDPTWSSTIFGPIMATSQMLPALAFSIVITSFLANHEPLANLDRPGLFNDLGNLLLAFVMLWTYMSFSQFLLIWTGNLPEEITWYARRSRNGWLSVALILVVFNFVMPFFLLLGRELKRRPERLRVVALAIVLLSFVHVYWIIAPTFSPVISLSWLDLASLAGVGGIWLTVFLWQVQTAPIMPVHTELAGEEAFHHA